MSPSSPSPRQLRQHISDLERFTAAYEAYLQGGSGGASRLRKAVIDAMPAAQRAMNVAEADLMVIDPPALGAHRQVYSGLANLAFLHERPGYRPTGNDPAVHEGLLDTLDTAVATLRDEIERQQAPPPQPALLDRSGPPRPPPHPGVHSRADPRQVPH